MKIRFAKPFAALLPTLAPALLLACSGASSQGDSAPVSDGPASSQPAETPTPSEAVVEAETPEPGLDPEPTPEANPGEIDVEDEVDPDEPGEDVTEPVDPELPELTDPVEETVDLDALEPAEFAGSDWSFDGTTLEAGPLGSSPGPSIGGGGLGAPGAAMGDFAGDPSTGFGDSPLPSAEAPPAPATPAGTSAGPIAPSPELATPVGATGAAPPDPIIGPTPTVPVEPTPAPQAGLLTAGEWKDLENWEFFRGLLDAAPEQGTDFSGLDEEWGYDFSERVSVTVLAGTEAVTNVLLTLRDASEQIVWQTMTDAAGTAELFPGLFTEAQGPYTLSAESGEEVVSAEGIEAGEQLTLELTGSSSGTGLDLMFMVDTTGSMSDELSYLQTELKDVIERVVTQSEDPLAVRLSVNFYRDTTDEYVVRSFPFTQDIDTALTALQQQYAGGGGDFPEAVDFALEVANQQTWNPKARARLMFLVLDAPPHSDQATQERVRQATAQLAKQGVEVIPLTASGIDKPTEFLMRFLGAATNGSYTFLTDHSGIGGAHLDPHPSIGAYDVEMLNDLLVRIVGERVARPAITLQPL